MTEALCCHGPRTTCCHTHGAVTAWTGRGYCLGRGGLIAARQSKHQSQVQPTTRWSCTNHTSIYREEGATYMTLTLSLSQWAYFITQHRSRLSLTSSTANTLILNPPAPPCCVGCWDTSMLHIFSVSSSLLALISCANRAQAFPHLPDTVLELNLSD